ncbi:hypothetical protein D3C76_870130 [compost metagenome]
MAVFSSASALVGRSSNLTGRPNTVAIKCSPNRSSGSGLAFRATSATRPDLPNALSVERRVSGLSRQRNPCSDSTSSQSLANALNTSIAVSGSLSIATSFCGSKVPTSDAVSRAFNTRSEITPSTAACTDSLMRYSSQDARLPGYRSPRQKSVGRQAVQHLFPQSP